MFPILPRYLGLVTDHKRSLCKQRSGGLRGAHQRWFSPATKQVGKSKEGCFSDELVVARDRDVLGPSHLV